MNDNKHNRQMTCHIKFDINNKKKSMPGRKPPTNCFKNHITT